jgi:hypothetical protein
VYIPTASYLHLGTQTGSLTSHSYTKHEYLYAFIISHIRATLLHDCLICGLVTLVTYGEMLLVMKLLLFLFIFLSKLYVNFFRYPDKHAAVQVAVLIKFRRKSKLVHRLKVVFLMPCIIQYYEPNDVSNL